MSSHYESPGTEDRMKATPKRGTVQNATRRGSRASTIFFCAAFVMLVSESVLGLARIYSLILIGLAFVSVGLIVLRYEPKSGIRSTKATSIHCCSLPFGVCAIIPKNRAIALIRGHTEQSGIFVTFAANYPPRDRIWIATQG